MSSDRRIINAVKRCPPLYTTNLPEAECVRLFKKLAQENDMSERYFSTRWYLLREWYQRSCKYGNKNGCFKYMKEMQFLQPYMRVSPIEPTVFTPEFVVTKEDLENFEFAEQYEFLEVETLDDAIEGEGEGKEEDKSGTVPLAVIKLERESPSIEDQQNFENSEISAACTTPTRDEEIQKSICDAATTTEASGRVTPAPLAVQNDIVVGEIIEVENGPNHIEPESNEMDTLPVTSGQQTVHQELADVESGQIKLRLRSQRPVRASRCEDVIFGELVVAMLQRMPPEKKRAIKKDIMNLMLA